MAGIRVEKLHNCIFVGIDPGKDGMIHGGNEVMAKLAELILTYQVEMHQAADRGLASLRAVDHGGGWKLTYSIWDAFAAIDDIVSLYYAMMDEIESIAVEVTITSTIKK